MTDTTRTTGRAAAAAAAKALLADRIKLVENLGAALDDHHRATQAVHTAVAAKDTAADHARAAHAAAQAGGWTSAELKAAGLDAPKAPRRTRSSTPAD